MAQFKAKIINIGHSEGVIIPKKLLKQFKKRKGDYLYLEIVDESQPEEVITSGRNKEVITSKKKENVITKKDKAKHQPFDICPKHHCFYNSCGC